MLKDSFGNYCSEIGKKEPRKITRKHLIDWLYNNYDVYYVDALKEYGLTITILKDNI